MRVRTHLALATVAAAAIGLSACGGAATGNALSGKPPADVVRAAADHLSSQSFRFDITLHLAVDASKAHGSGLGSLGALGQGLNITGNGEAESAQRLRMTLSLKPLVNQDVVVVVYDGQTFVSLDGGSKFAEGSSFKSLTGGLGVTPDSLKQLYGNLKNVQDLGAESKDGVNAEHYRIAVDQSLLSQILGQAAGSGSAGLGAIIGQLVQLNGGTVDSWVNSADGTLDRSTAHISLSFDLDKLGQIFGGLATGQSGGSSTDSGALPSGSLGFDIGFDMHPHDYGASIHVTKPTVDPAAPTLPAQGGLFG